jgi:phage-related minor tail protein
MLCQFSEMRRLREEARATVESELKARKQRIDQQFSESRSIFATKQQEVSAKITQKYEEEMI